MGFQPPYVYILEMENTTPAVFTWSNVAKKYIRDIYTNVDGELTLPPPGHLILKRFKVNPKAGQPVVMDFLPIEKFLATK